MKSFGAELSYSEFRQVHFVPITEHGHPHQVLLKFAVYILNHDSEEDLIFFL